ncbi:hypothetical protein BJ170DRAFT_683956 [Xylariales sp. AK1849]|nr:hypothetical protein BJ170DRAFT_683956 [Xylariales sp. AK1849]
MDNKKPGLTRWSVMARRTGEDQEAKTKELLWKIREEGAASRILQGYDSYTGFLPLPDYLELTPWPPAEIGPLRWRLHYGSPQVATFDDRTPDLKEEVPPPCRLLLYRDVYEDNNWDDGARYVFMPKTKSNDVTCGDCYIRVIDFYERICGGELARNTLLADLQAWRDYKTANEEGKIDHFREQALHFKLNPVRMDGDFNVNVTTEGILIRSKGERRSPEDFYGRYWDHVIPEECHKFISDGFMIVFSDSVRTCFPLAQSADILLQHLRNIVQIALKKKIKFQPSINENNTWLASEFKVRVVDHDPQKWHQLETHPGGLYTIWIDDGATQVLMNQPVPFIDYHYPFPDQERAQRLNGLLNRAEKLKREPSTTKVNIESIEGAKNKKRRPNQDACMHSKGFSANKAVTELWGFNVGFDQKYAQKYRLGEWLHRSAFSYGGLWAGNGPAKGGAQSSQTAHNLILGSRETNTVMLIMLQNLHLSRYESFVKRLAKYSNTAFGKGTTVTVNTNFSYAMLKEKDKWIGDCQYCWLTPVLTYHYQNEIGDEPVRHSIPLFDAWVKVRALESQADLYFAGSQAILDKVVENACWKWNEDISAEVPDPAEEFTKVLDYDEENNLLAGAVDATEEVNHTNWKNDFNDEANGTIEER